jgi:hypothetical protein
VKEWDEDAIVKNFKKAETGLREMTTTLMRMRDHLDPLEFYHGMRPYLGIYSVNIFS